MNKDAIKFKKLNLFNEQIMNCWKQYTHQNELIGKSFVFNERKLFKKITKEKILSDSWIECSFDLIGKDNQITHFNNVRVREFSEINEIMDKIQKTILTKPDEIIKDFSIKCEVSYIEKNKSGI